MYYYVFMTTDMVVNKCCEQFSNIRWAGIFLGQVGPELYLALPLMAVYRAKLSRKKNMATSG